MNKPDLKDHKLQKAVNRKRHPIPPMKTVPVKRRWESRKKSTHDYLDALEDEDFALAGHNYSASNPIKKMKRK